MDERLLSVPSVARLLYDNYEKNPKSKENMVRRKCADGTIKHARKINGSWRIHVRMEWPELFRD